METQNFAEYILNEEDYSAKLEILYFLSKKQDVFFNKTVVFKTEIARMFLKYNSLGVDSNIVLTACLLCNCKRTHNIKDIDRVNLYTKEGAQYLRSLGFNPRFCKICEEVNRSSGSNPREKESDVLELVDQFGGMLLDREERIGFKVDEALVLLKHRNLKNYFNRYVDTFEQFIDLLKDLNIDRDEQSKVLNRLISLYYKSNSNMEFIRSVLYDFEPKVDSVMDARFKKVEQKIFEKNNNERPLFTEETTKRIIGDKYFYSPSEAKKF